MLLLQGNHYSTPPTSSATSTMYEEDFMSQRARHFPLSHPGLMPSPQAFSFGFPVHPAHDPMSLSSEYYNYF